MLTEQRKLRLKAWDRESNCMGMGKFSQWRPEKGINSSAKGRREFWFQYLLVDWITELIKWIHFIFSYFLDFETEVLLPRLEPPLLSEGRHPNFRVGAEMRKEAQTYPQTLFQRSGMTEPSQQVINHLIISRCWSD